MLVSTKNSPRGMAWIRSYSIFAWSECSQDFHSCTCSFQYKTLPLHQKWAQIAAFSRSYNSDLSILDSTLNTVSINKSPVVLPYERKLLVFTIIWLIFLTHTDYSKVCVLKLDVAPHPLVRGRWRVSCGFNTHWVCVCVPIKQFQEKWAEHKPKKSKSWQVRP